MPDNVVILAGGDGKRMKTDIPKVLCKVLEIPMIQWVINACKGAGLENICIVKGFAAEMLDFYLDGKYTTVLQKERLGTGHAVMQAMDFLKENSGGNTLVLCGDAPFVDEKTIKSALELHQNDGNAVTVVTANAEDPTGYGRIIRDGKAVKAIVEQKDASEEQLRISEINSGCYWFKTDTLCELLPQLRQNNSQSEYYLTDCLSAAVEKGLGVGAYMSENPSIALGANDRRGLLALNDIARKMVIDKHLDNGVEFVCLDGVIISPDVIIGQGTKILPGVIIKGRSFIGKNCEIGPNCVIEDTRIGDNVILNNVQAYQSVVENKVKIGPFVQLRPGSCISEGAKIGDFVEIKNSTVGRHTSVSHLTYIGDSDVGANVNFGCGVVTVNYDGEKKFRTTIGDNAFIGCNTNLVAPVTIGDGAYTAAGSTITGDVPDGALAIERGKTAIKPGYALKKLKTRIEKFEKNN